MLVRMWMSDEVITASPELPIMEARELMKEHNIRRLPVVDKRGRLIGIVTQGDIQEASPSDATTLSIWELNYLLARITVEEIMTRDVITITPDTPVEEAALLMRERKVGGLPVVEDGKLVGIITESDIFEVMIKVMGVRKGGTRLTLELEDRPGALAEALGLIKKHEVNVLSVVTCEECPAPPGYGVVVLRLATAQADPIVKELEGAGIKITDVRICER